MNLDSMTVGELWELYDEAKNHIRLTAKKYGLSVADMKLYKHYAVNKAVAMQLRTEGNNEASKYEAICERLYSQMNVRQW